MTVFVDRTSTYSRSRVDSRDDVRDYVAERFSLAIAGLTTEEFLAHAETQRKLTAARRELLSAFLAQCDLVKFARRAPTAAERERGLDAIETFVRETAA